MKCWYCSDLDSTKSKKDGMCNVCKNHKSAIKYKDDTLGIDPNCCYCCDGGVISNLSKFDYCGRNCCKNCFKIDEKRYNITILECHTPV